jgi:hypothetical protein
MSVIEQNIKLTERVLELEADNAQLTVYLDEARDKVRELEAIVDQFWDGLWNRYNIESREEIEKDTKESWAEGTSPLNVALHYIWKREPKVAELEAELAWWHNLVQRHHKNWERSNLKEIVQSFIDRVDEIEDTLGAIAEWNTTEGDIMAEMAEEALKTTLPPPIDERERE